MSASRRNIPALAFQAHRRRSAISRAGTTRFAPFAGFRLLRIAAAAAAAIAAGLAVPGAVAAPADAAQHAPPTRFAIPPGDLDVALNRFGRQAGVAIAVDAELTRGLRSPGVSGHYSPAEALDALLAGTGLRGQRNAQGEYTVVRASDASLPHAALEPILVVGRNAGASDLHEDYAGGQVARGSQLGFLGNQDFLDTPYSTVAYTSEYLRDRQAQRLSDVIGQSDPSVEFDRINGYAEQVYIRGYASAAQDITYGGLYGVLPSMRIYPEMAERIEVLKGPSVLLNGMMPNGSIGGVVNLVPKRAPAETLAEVTATYSSRRHAGGHIDLGQRFGDRQQWGLRFNGFYRGGESEIHGQDKNVGLAMLGLDWHSDRLRLSADIFTSREKAKGFGYWGFYGDIYDSGVPTPPSPSRLLNSPDSYYRNQDNAAVARAEFDLNADWLAYAAFGGRSSRFTSLANHIDINDLAGNTSDMWYYWSTQTRSYSGLVGLRGNFSTGPVRHTLNFNVTGYQAKTYDAEETFDDLPSWHSNIYRLDYGPAPEPTGVPYDLASRDRLRSVGIADTLSFADDTVLLTLGVRKQWVRSDNYAWDEYYDADAVSPAVALVWKATPSLSLYGNYTQGLSAGGVAPSDAANAGQSLPPYKSKQYEAGVKYDQGDWAVTLSLFQIERPDAGYDANNTYRVLGDTRNRGVELTTMGEPWRGLRLLGGVAFNFATYEGSAAGGNAGNRVAGIPRALLKLGAEYDVAALPGLTLTGNVMSSTRQALRDTNSEFVPGWTRVDLGARYRTRLGGHDTTFRLEVQNIANKAYWLAPAYNGMGAPRTVLGSVTVAY